MHINKKIGYIIIIMIIIKYKYTLITKIKNALRMCSASKI